VKPHRNFYQGSIGGGPTGARDLADFATVLGLADTWLLADFAAGLGPTGLLVAVLLDFAAGVIAGLFVDFAVGLLTGLFVDFVAVELFVLWLVAATTSSIGTSSAETYTNSARPVDSTMGEKDMHNILDMDMLTSTDLARLAFT
jgi:hypothetical protein